ncbi:MAG: metallophosphoesterase [Bacilli bacterium]|nr:metallophosphoesterase [Bacilli bacterium]
MTREELNKDIRAKVSHESNKENTKKIVKIIIKLLLFFGIIGTLFFLYTTYVSTAKVMVREYRIINQKIPTSFNGLKIVQLSDLHYGSTMLDEELKKVINLVNERKPDLVVFTGDLIDKNYKLTPKEQEKIISNFKNIKATTGKYAILGDEDTEKIATIFNQSNFVILRDEYDLIYNSKDNPILLIGVNSTSKNPDIDKAFNYYKEPTHLSNIYTISLIHEPDLAEDINYQSDLILAGHSHNGNIRIPFAKKALFKVAGAKKYDQDYYHINNSELYVSSGLGTKSGIRLFCRPSINFFRLSNK